MATSGAGVVGFLVRVIDIFAENVIFVKNCFSAERFCCKCVGLLVSRKDEIKLAYFLICL